MICITGSALSVGLFGVGAVLGASIADVTDWGATAGLALMFIGRILHGVTGGTAAAAQAMIVDVTPPAQRTQALGLVGVAIGLGFVIGPGAASWLMEIYLSLPIAIAIALLNRLLTLFFLGNPCHHSTSALIQPGFPQSLPEHDSNLESPPGGALELGIWLVFLLFSTVA